MSVTILFVGEDTFHFAVAFQNHSVGVGSDQEFQGVVEDIVEQAFHRPSYRLES